jgi:PAS domain S-box-containing protein
MPLTDPPQFAVPTDAWLAAIVDSSDDAIIGKTLDSIIRSWNKGATRTFGFTAKEAIGQSIRILIPDDRHAEEDMILNRLRNGERVDHFETVRKRKDGTLVDVSVSVAPILDEAGRIVGASKIARDISLTRRLLVAERELSRQLQDQAVELEAQAVELEQQMEESQRLQVEVEDSNLALNKAVDDAQRARREAESANSAKSSFLAMMSHELRTPLNAIAGYVQLLEMEVQAPVTETQRMYLGRIKTSGELLLRLIEEILAFAKLESGRLEFHIGDVCLNEIIGRLNTFAEVQVKKQDIDYSVHLCPNDLMVHADPDKVEQILLNLLTNAVKFTERGRIEVSCQSTAKDVRIAVDDTGDGIPPRLLEQIFEPFVQGERRLSGRSSGTGLGLSISRQLARAMHGDVTVRSVEGKGSTFTLILPRASN